MQELTSQIESLRKDIRTDRYSMSIGEWVSLYKNKELDIHPEFQRFFRWSSEQKSKLIESLLLGIPVPQIFVSQREDGTWDVIDGLQRLSTIFELMGILEDEKGKLLPPLILDKTKYLPALEGKYWEPGEDDEDESKTIGPKARLLIKREKFDVSIILQESDKKSKYELFQRLNTGGSSLSPQEVRNCILVMINREMYVWLRNLANYQNFKDAISLTDRAVEEQYDMELALRFIIFRKMPISDLSSLEDVNDFLTDKMSFIAELPDFNYEEETKAFEDTFDLIISAAKESAFKKYDIHKGKFLGGFLLSAFEVISSGIGYSIGSLNTSPADILTRIKGIWTNDEFEKYSGSGVRASSRVPKLIPLGRTIFA